MGEKVKIFSDQKGVQDRSEADVLPEKQIGENDQEGDGDGGSAPADAEPGGETLVQGVPGRHAQIGKIFHIGTDGTDKEAESGLQAPARDIRAVGAFFIAGRCGKIGFHDSILTPQACAVLSVYCDTCAYPGRRVPGA